MELIQYKYKKTKKRLAQLNRYRIWLGVTTLSIITDASWKFMPPYTLKGQKHPRRRTIYNWRNQHQIGGKF